jgi:hypothetical protein
MIPSEEHKLQRHYARHATLTQPQLLYTYLLEINANNVLQHSNKINSKQSGLIIHSYVIHWRYG